MRRRIQEQWELMAPKHRQMAKKLKEKIRESVSSVLPISLVVLILGVSAISVSLSNMALFMLGAVMLVVGMGLFTLGAETAMLPMGSLMGAEITKKRSLVFLAVIAFVLGVMVTLAEPDLSVLSDQISGVPKFVLMLTVAVGVGLFLVVALLRILFQWKLSYILVGLYAAVFALGIFIRPESLPMAFDSGGVTTGPMTVPFLLALGSGVANVRGGSHSQDDSFGLVALCSVGPILAMMIISLFFPGLKSTVSEAAASVPLATTKDLMLTYAQGTMPYFLDVLIALSPIVVLFFAFQIFSLHLPGAEIRRMLVGILYTYLGLVIFLTGVNIGFLPMGDYLGRAIASGGKPWALIPLGMLMGYLVVAAEPAVHVLNAQVEEITSGAISRRVMMRTMSVGVSVSVGLSMVRVLTGISIWWFLAPGYALALGLSFVTDPVFTGIAFDSGGVASGPLTAAFVLPLAMGACAARGGNIMCDAFGLVAMVAMTPLIAIEVLGVVYRLKTSGRPTPLPPAAPEAEEDDDAIIDV